MAELACSTDGAILGASPTLHPTQWTLQPLLKKNANQALLTYYSAKKPQKHNLKMILEDGVAEFFVYSVAFRVVCLWPSLFLLLSFVFSFNPSPSLCNCCPINLCGKLSLAIAWKKKRGWHNCPWLAKRTECKRGGEQRGNKHFLCVFLLNCNVERKGWDLDCADVCRVDNTGTSSWQIIL